MGNHKSGNFEHGKMTAKDKRDAVRAYNRKHKPMTALQLSFKYQVSPQYIYMLLKPKAVKSLESK